MYIYVTDLDVKRMSYLNTNEGLNELLQEARVFDNSILISEDYYYTYKKGYRGWLFGEKEKKFRYTLYHNSPAHDGSPYQALQMSCTSSGVECIIAYLYGVINCALHNKLTNRDEQI